MFRKICLFSLFFSLFLFKKEIFSKDDYLEIRDNYFSQRSRYLAAKQSYLNYRTIQAKEKLIQELSSFLYLRNRFLASYFEILTETASPLLGEEDSQPILAWKGWLDENLTNLSNLKTLEDLLANSREFKSKYQKNEREIYIFLTKLKIAERQKIIGEILKLIDDLEKAEFFDNFSSSWREEIQHLLQEVDADHQRAMEKITEKYSSIPSSWAKAKENLEVGGEKIKQVLAILDEVGKNVKDKE